MIIIVYGIEHTNMCEYIRMSNVVGFQFVYVHNSYEYSKCKKRTCELED